MCVNHLPSSSTIVIVVRPVLPWVTPSGSALRTIVREKSSLCSNILSSFMGTSNVTLVTPAVKVTVYGPES